MTRETLMTTSSVATSLELRLFGPFEARVRGVPLPPLRTRKDAWLLALLVLHGGRPLDRAWLAGTLWPESEETSARANLRKSLKSLRHALGDQADRIQAPTPRALRLALAGADVDLLTFDAAVADAARGRAGAATLEERLEAAVALYRGPLLDGCHETWVLLERQWREEAYLDALEWLADRAGSRGEWGRAQRWLRRALAVHPLRESAHRSLMQVLACSGNHAAALQVYRDLRLRLHRELSVPPDRETTALFDVIRVTAGEHAHCRRSPLCRRKDQG